MLAVSLDVAEPVGPDARAGVDRDPIPDHRTAVHRHRRIEVASIPDPNRGADDRVCADYDRVAELRAVADDRVWSDRDVASERDSDADHRRRMNAPRRGGRSMEAWQQ